VSQSDPTDNALAAIASILDQPEIHRDPETAPLLRRSRSPRNRSRRTAIPRSVPGPMAAIRFKWTVREDRGDYYVDETIGEYSAPIVTGPMTMDAAIQLVDDREADARHRF